MKMTTEQTELADKAVKAALTALNGRAIELSSPFTDPSLHQIVVDAYKAGIADGIRLDHSFRATAK